MYTENKSIDGLTAITPTIDDLVVTMDQAEVGVAKSSTLLSVYNLFKTTYDTVYAKYLGDADFYKYSIVRSVGNIIVNNSFETDLSGWSGWLSASFTRDTTEYYHGVASAKIVTDGYTYAQGCYSAVTTKVGSTYAYSCYVKGTAGKQITMFIDGGTLPEIYQTLTGGWDRITGSVTATTTNTSIYIQCRTAGVTTYWVDAVQVEEGTTVAGPFTTTQGNLTVTLKNYEGNDPTPSKPVKIQIGGVIRTITSNLSVVLEAGGSWMNLGSAELATKEVDLFTYVYWYDTTTPARVGFAVARKPGGNIIGDFDYNGPIYSENKFVFDWDGSNSPSATTPVTNIGRFNATLSAGAGYTWSIPATSVIINSPIYETRYLDYIPVGAGYTAGGAKYRIDGNNLYVIIDSTANITGNITVPLTCTNTVDNQFITSAGTAVLPKNSATITVATNPQNISGFYGI